MQILRCCLHHYSRFIYPVHYFMCKSHLLSAKSSIGDIAVKIGGSCKRILIEKFGKPFSKELTEIFLYFSVNFSYIFIPFFLINEPEVFHQNRIPNTQILETRTLKVILLFAKKLILAGRTLFSLFPVPNIFIYCSGPIGPWSLLQ